MYVIVLKHALIIYVCMYNNGYIKSGRINKTTTEMQEYILSIYVEFTTFKKPKSCLAIKSF